MRIHTYVCCITSREHWDAAPFIPTFFHPHIDSRACTKECFSEDSIEGHRSAAGFFLFPSCVFSSRFVQIQIRDHTFVKHYV